MISTIRANFLALSLLGLLTACQSQPDIHTLRTKLIADALLSSNDKALREGDNFLKSMQAQVERNGKQASDVALLQQSKEIQEQTKATILYIRQLEEDLLAKVGNQGQAQKLADASIVEDVILSKIKGLTPADSLQQQLVAYSKFIGPILAQNPEQLGLASAGGPTRTEAGSYSEFYFQDASVAEALAMLAQQEAQVLKLGLDALQKQSQKVPTSFGYSVVRPYAVAEANSIKEGEPYRATLLLVSSVAGFPMTMTANGKPIKVMANQGQVEFTVPVQVGRSEKSQAYWDASITALVAGQDTTFRLRIPYTIYKK
jgi:hypothetical protein